MMMDDYMTLEWSPAHETCDDGYTVPSLPSLELLKDTDTTNIQIDWEPQRIRTGI